ncbi:MAG: pre-peptidase C-terminal domain-containing protein [Halorientalis sp.]
MVLGVFLPGAAAVQQANDRFEPNDQRTNAAAIQPGSFDDLSIQDGEDDFYAVQLQQGETLEVSIDFDHSRGDLDLEVQGPSGFTEGSSASVTDGETVTVTASQTGTYYVRAYGFAGAGGPYSMDVSVQEGGGDTGMGGSDDPDRRQEQSQLSPDRFEDNDGQDAATGLPPGSYGNLTIDSADDEDFYAVYLAEGQTLTAEMGFSHADGDLDLEVQGPDGGVEGSSVSVTDGETVETTADESGIYYVRAYGFVGATAPYDLTLEVDGAGTNATSLSVEATAASPGETTTITYTVTNNGDAPRSVRVESGVGDLPSGWSVESRDAGDAAWNADRSAWLFQRIEPGESVSSSLEVAVPDDASGNVDLTATLHSSGGTSDAAATVTVNTGGPLGVTGPGFGPAAAVVALAALALVAIRQRE